MSRLAKKFLLGLSIIMAAVLLCSLFLNSRFIGRYFLYQEKQDLMRICNGLLAAAENGTLAQAIAEAEETEDVILARVASTDDNNVLNESLRAAFSQKGISYERFWLWEQDQLTAQQQGRQLRVYSQEKLHYSIMVEYLSVGEDFIAAAKIVPSTAGTIALVNRVTGLVFLGAAAVIFLLVVFLVRRITGPLVELGQAARSIAALDFQRLSLHTGDELEDLADDMNAMSEKLAQAHRELETKNRQMEALLANVSHDLKTPVALIQAYADGMRDGMDDGTFLDTISRHNNRIQVILERLLEYARLEQAPLAMESCRLDELLEEALTDYKLQAGARGLCFARSIAAPAPLLANRETIRTLLDNLVSNAVKYACGPEIAVTLQNQDESWLFTIRNLITLEQPLSTERLWEPFYVADSARNKETSGTGLGLALVRAAAQRCGYACHCSMDGDWITFSIVFPKTA